MSAAKIESVAKFATSALFDSREKAALRFTEEMCRTPVDVPDDVFEELRRYFDEGQIVELTATIALENLRARFNRSLLIPSDGFCALPENHPALSPAAGARQS